MPKTYAIVHPDKFALFVGPFIRVLVAVLAPIVMGVQFIVKNVMKLFGVDISKATNILSAHDELRGAIDLHHREGAVVKRDRDMLGGILDLRELELSDVMVHRTKMHMIEGTLEPSEIITDVLNSGYTRVPVWTDDPDNITGILHAKDLLSALQANKGEASKINVQSVVTKPWFVPDTTPVVDQLNAFLRRKTHFAIVIDEYGEVMGLVTLEDILEEIVGEIADEHDTEVTGVTREASGAFVIDGTTPIRDLNREYDWNLPDDEATTIAGLVIHEAQVIPDEKQAFTFHGFRFEVLGKRHNQLTSIKVTPLSAVRSRNGAAFSPGPTTQQEYPRRGWAGGDRCRLNERSSPQGALADIDSACTRSSQFLRQGLVDHPVPRNQRLSRKCVGNNLNSKVRLAFRPRTRVACMLVGFVDDIELCRSEGIC